MQNEVRSGLARRVVMLTVLFGLLASACGGSTAPTNEAGAPGDVAVTTTTIPTATALLDGQYTVFGGPDIDLASVHGEDVVLWFWAPW